jgi:hypothetical protein
MGDEARGLGVLIFLRRRAIAEIPTPFASCFLERKGFSLSLAPLVSPMLSRALVTQVTQKNNGSFSIRPDT